jgi:hypothetical protein
MRRSSLVLLTLAAIWLCLSHTEATAPRPPGIGPVLPDLVLWAWERPTDLRGLDAHTGVAFLAQTILVGDRRTTVAPRRHPLRVSPATPLVAVTRLESPHDVTAFLEDEDLDALAARIAGTARLPRVVAVQIDFDATSSERVFYRRLLSRVRAALPPGTPLSMTALASWCVGDNWLAGLPVDEAVPMLFRMGPINEPYAAIGDSPAQAAQVCRTAVGTSLDEPMRIRGRARRVYVFDNEAWSASTVARAKEVIE